MLTVETSAPSGLLAKIRRAIDAGHVKTWSYDTDGDFTHDRPQWRGKAWLRPQVEQGVLTLQIIRNSNVPLTPEIYGVYHGRFAEMLLAHFRDELSLVTAN